MALKFEVDQIVEETQGDQAGSYSVYVKVFDDAAPETILARPCVQGTTKDEIKTAMKTKLATVKQRLNTVATAAQAAAAALAETVQEDQL